MPRFKFYIDVLNLETGEVYGSFETKSVGLPAERKPIEKYMTAYLRKLETFPDLRLGMTVRCERMVNGQPFKVCQQELSLPF